VTDHFDWILFLCLFIPIAAIIVFTTIIVICALRIRKRNLIAASAKAKASYEGKFEGRPLPGADGEFMYEGQDKRKPRVDYLINSGFAMDQEEEASRGVGSQLPMRYQAPVAVY